MSFKHNNRNMSQNFGNQKKRVISPWGVWENAIGKGDI